MAAQHSVHQIFSATVDRHGDRPFLHIPASAAPYAGRAIDVTYAQAWREVAARRDAYAQAGYGCGHRAALMLDNRADFFFHWLALNALGVSIVPLNAEATVADLAYIVDDCRPDILITLLERRAHATAVAAAVRHALAVADADLSDLAPPTSAPAAAADECALLYTSGSTGKPKGCILSNTYFEVMGAWYRDVGGLCAMAEGCERLLTPLPLVHMNALATSTMAMLMTGGCIIQLDRFHPRIWWRTVAETQATIVHYLGVLPAMLLNLPPAPEERAHVVRFGFGAGVNPRHQRPFEERFGFPLIEAWSMTEVGGAAVVIANREPRHVGTSCFGKPEAFMEWRLVDDAGQDVAPGTPGELLVRRAGDDPRHGFFSGYLNLPEETENAWADGWFHTGDMVRRGPDGSLHFVDRKKSIIRRSGENISALEVEAVLSQLPGVLAVGVAPAPDDIRGEEVFAALVLPAGAPREAQEAERLAAAALDHLTYYKIPGYIAFVDALPLTPSQKLQRGELKSWAKTLVADGRAHDVRHLKSRHARKTG